jgi:hypothetical protein
MAHWTAERGGLVWAKHEDLRSWLARCGRGSLREKHSKSAVTMSIEYFCAICSNEVRADAAGDSRAGEKQILRFAQDDGFGAAGG